MSIYLFKYRLWSKVHYIHLADRLCWLLAAWSECAAMVANKGEPLGISVHKYKCARLSGVWDHAHGHKQIYSCLNSRYKSISMVEEISSGTTARVLSYIYIRTHITWTFVIYTLFQDRMWSNVHYIHLADRLCRLLAVWSECAVMVANKRQPLGISVHKYKCAWLSGVWDHAHAHRHTHVKIVATKGPHGQLMGTRSSG